MDFDEMVNALKEKREDIPETIYDDLSNAYRLTVEGSAAAIAQRQAALDAQQAEIMRLKAQNFELLMKAPAIDTDEDRDDNKGEVKTPPGIDGLFRIG